MRGAIVTGGREFPPTLESALWRTLHAYGPAIVLHGGAPGADGMAGRYAQTYAVELIMPYLGRFGRAGGHKRNEALAIFADIYQDAIEWRVFAFPGPASRGTWDAVALFEARGFIVTQHGPWAR